MEKKDSDKWSSSSTKGAAHHGLCDVIPRGSLEMSEGARQFVVADPLLVEHVKYSVSSNGWSESGSEAQCLYPVCAICARHRHRELISLTSRTRRTSRPRHPPQTVLIGGSPCCDLCIAVRTECTPTESHTIVMFYVLLAQQQHMHLQMRLSSRRSRGNHL